MGYTFFMEMMNCDSGYSRKHWFKVTYATARLIQSTGLTRDPSKEKPE